MNKLKFFILIFFTFYVDSFSQDETQGIRPLSLHEHIKLLFNQRDQFPELLRESLLHHPEITIKKQQELLERLNKNENFRRMMRERGDLLTIRIQDAQDVSNVTREVIDEDYLRQWGGGSCKCSF